MNDRYRTIAHRLKQWQEWWLSWWQGQSALFRSARLKLTAFYLTILLAFCLTLTISVRVIAEHEYLTEGAGERGIVRQLLFTQYSVPPISPNTFNAYQRSHLDAVHDSLNRDLVFINLGVLVLGGLLSYWFAGRTLRPIEQAHINEARFASDASHELRTPLATLRVENEVFLRQKDFTQGEARELIESNLEEVQRLERLSASLLALTQYENQALHLSPVDIRQVVDEALVQLEKLAKEKKVSFEVAIPAVKILGNFDSLVQLVSIICENAIKYGPPAGQVYIDGERRGGDFMLYIRDQGPGFAEEDLPLVFDRLYRGDKARSSKVSGYGLGLSLAREIVLANHGTVEATNYPNGGAVLIVALGLAGNSSV